MEKNYNFPIPNLDFDFLPVGIDIRKVLKEGVCPAIHGGMFNRVGRPDRRGHGKSADAVL